MKIYIQGEGIFICGKISEVRRMLSAYTCTHRTVKELIKKQLN